MSLFDLIKKKKGTPAPVATGTVVEPKMYTEDEVQSLLQAERDKQTSGMSQKELSAFIGYCTKLGATDIQKSCIDSGLNFSDSMSTLMSETINVVEDVTKDFNNFNPNAGNAKFDNLEGKDKGKANYTSLSEAIPDIVKTRKVTFVQAKDIAMEEYPELFINPHNPKNKG